MREANEHSVLLHLLRDMHDTHGTGSTKTCFVGDHGFLFWHAPGHLIERSIFFMLRTPDMQTAVSIHTQLDPHYKSDLDVRARLRIVRCRSQVNFVSDGYQNVLPAQDRTALQGAVTNRVIWLGPDRAACISCSGAAEHALRKVR